MFRKSYIGFQFYTEIFVMFAGVSNLFVFCFFGKMATESFEGMADCIAVANWQTLSIGLQKNLVLIMANAQRPLYYHGFHIYFLNLQTFTKVRPHGQMDHLMFTLQFDLKTYHNFQLIKTVFTYYMMFKTVTE